MPDASIQYADATHLSVLPKDLLDLVSSQVAGPSTELQFVRLPHPRTNVPCLFLPYESRDGKKSGLLEVQAISPSTAPRSWFLEGDKILQDGKLLVMTPIDPMFLLIPLLRFGTNSELHFKPLDDLIEDICNVVNAEDEIDVNVQDITYLASRACVHKALKRITEFKEIGGGIMVYRFSQEKTIQSLRRKVDRLSTSENFELSRTAVSRAARDGLMEDGNEILLQQGRVKSANDLLSQYLPPDLKQQLLASYDLAALEEHLEKMRAEELARALAENPPPKPKAKALKKENSTEKKRKAPPTAADKLSKVSTRGMAKMQSFFTKAPKTKAAA